MSIISISTAESQHRKMLWQPWAMPCGPEDNGSFLEGDDEVGASVGIKDVWLDDDRPREGATLTRLLEEASKDDKPLLKKHLLMVLSDGDVRIGNKVDNTRNLVMRQQDIPWRERFWLPDKSYEPHSGHVSDIGLTASWDEFRHTRAPPMTNRPFQNLHGWLLMRWTFYVTSVTIRISYSME
jgi:hypothetical protein